MSKRKFRKRIFVDVFDVDGKKEYDVFSIGKTATKRPATSKTALVKQISKVI